MGNSLGNKEIFAKNLRYYMDLNTKTRSDVCEALGFSYTTFSDWFNAKKYPRIDKIEMLANYFGIKKADLVEERNEEPNYYTDSETARLAQFLCDNREYKVLFDAVANVKPDDISKALKALNIFIEE